MKKSFMLIAAAAAMFAACQQEDVVIDQSSNLEEAIGFGTYTPGMTRADNSTGEDGEQLEKYHNTFAVYGFKNVGSTETQVFNKTECTYTDSPANPYYAEVSAGDWTYSPVRYWDKAADGYDFYAYSPKEVSFTLAGVPGDYYFTLAAYSVDGKSLKPDTKVTGQNLDCFAATNVNTADPMIATDVKGYKTYSKQHVQLDFNHILSRLNLAVKTTVPATGAKVTLKKLMVYNMQSKGDFQEKTISGTTVSEFTGLSDGTAARWNTGYGETHSFGYDGTTSNYITGGTADGYVLTDAYNYVYQTLIIPQTIAAETINLNGKDLNTSTAKPYLYIEYEIAYTSGETETNFGYYNLASLFQNGYAPADANGRIPYQTEGGVSLYLGTDDKYYTEAGEPVTVIYKKDSDYFKALPCTDANKMDLTNTDDANLYTDSYHVLVGSDGQPIRATRGDADVTFCEGWQNNLLITIDPVAILFDASVYKWVTKENVDVTIQ